MVCYTRRVIQYVFILSALDNATTNCACLNCRDKYPKDKRRNICYGVIVLLKQSDKWWLENTQTALRARPQTQSQAFPSAEPRKCTHACLLIPNRSLWDSFSQKLVKITNFGPKNANQNDRFKQFEGFEREVGRVGATSCGVMEWGFPSRSSTPDAIVTTKDGRQVQTQTRASVQRWRKHYSATLKEKKKKKYKQRGKVQ